MCALLRSQAPHQKHRVMGLVRDLCDDIDRIDLDTIDGEFYWRACRLDLLGQVEALLQSHDVAGAMDDVIVARGDHEQTLDQLRHHLRRASALLKVESQIERLYPRSVWRRLLEGERVAMRAAEAELRDSSHGSGKALSVKVYSGAWTGAEVEDEVRRQDPDATVWLEMLERPNASSQHVRLAVDFAFGVEHSGSAHVSGNDMASPYVCVTVPLPMPPSGVIRREYEALVRDEQRWHTALPGGGTQQDKLVAIRTWCVGLLMHLGVTYQEVMREIAQSTSLGEVSQTRFQEDRGNLITRVPEARPYLYTRKTVSPISAPISSQPDMARQRLDDAAELP